MRYVFERNTTDRWEKITSFDDLDEAIYTAAEDSRKYKSGTAEHRVKDVRSDAIKYRRGWIDKEVRLAGAGSRGALAKANTVRPGEND